MRPETFDDNYTPCGGYAGSCPVCCPPRPSDDGYSRHHRSIFANALIDIHALAFGLTTRYTDAMPPVDAMTAILEARTLLRKAAGEKP